MTHFTDAMQKRMCRLEDSVNGIVNLNKKIKELRKTNPATEIPEFLTNQSELRSKELELLNILKKKKCYGALKLYNEISRGGTMTDELRNYTEFYEVPLEIMYLHEGLTEEQVAENMYRNMARS